MSGSAEAFICEEQTWSTCPNHYALFDAIEARITASDTATQTLFDRSAAADGQLAGPVTVAEAVTMLRNPETGTTARDAMWTELVQLARVHSGPWQLVAVWAVTPILRATTWRLTRRFAVEHADAQSEVLLGFLEALDTVDLTASDLSRTLWRAANRHAFRACRRPHGLAPVRDLSVADRDAVDEDRLSAAVVPIHSDVCDADESLGVVSLETAAHAFGFSVATAYKLVSRGAFPCEVIRPTWQYRVPTPALMAALGLDVVPVRFDVEAGMDFAARFDEPQGPSSSV